MVVRYFLLFTLIILFAGVWFLFKKCNLIGITRIMFYIVALNIKWHHICMGKQRQCQRWERPLHIYEHSLFHIPVSHVRESFTRAAHALTNYNAPILWGIRRQWHSCVQKNTGIERVEDISSKFFRVWHFLEIAFPQRVKEQWKGLWRVCGCQGKIRRHQNNCAPPFMLYSLSLLLNSTLGLFWN